MSKGTPSRGKHNKGHSHIRCRRCGKATFHASRKECSSCGYGNSAKLKKHNWWNSKSLYIIHLS